MRLWAAVLTVTGLLAIGCRSQPPVSPSPPPATTNPPAPSPAPPATGLVTGTWEGTGSDSFSAERVTWTLTQSEATVTGRVELSPMDPNDGSCASCHKLRKGTVTGTIDGATLTLSMNFPAGGDVPTPVCITDLTATATVSGNQLTGSYTGTDTCEGFYANGQLALVGPTLAR